MTHTLLYLSRQDVEGAALPMGEIILALEGAFQEKAQGRTETPPKPGIHPQPDAFIHAMPALVPSVNAAGIKWVSGYPANPRKGLPYINGLLILNDPETGLPIAVMDCTWITGQRTAAASALAARYLARADSQILAVCGCGVQGRTHLEALKVVCPDLREVIAYDISPEALERFVDEMEGRYPSLDFHRATSAQMAVQEADLVVTAGPILRQPSPTIQPNWLRGGAFATAVDFDCYWTPAALKEIDLIITDDREQLDYYRSLGFFRSVRPVDGDLAQLVSGERPGRTNRDQTTMAMFLGLALEDMVTAVRVLERAREQGIGTELPL